MKLEHIYILDHDNKLYDHMVNLREDVINLIQTNVCKMIQAKRNIQISSADFIPSKEYTDRLKYTWSQSLYDRLISEYNQAHPNDLLAYWSKPSK